MPTSDYRQVGGDALLSFAKVEAEEATSLADMPGGCAGERFPLFVEVEADVLAEAALVPGGHVRFEFELPGKPGRWLAAGEVCRALPAGAKSLPSGVCLELLGLTLTSKHTPALQAGGAAKGGWSSFDSTTLEMGADDIGCMLSDLLGREVVGESSAGLEAGLPDNAVVAIFRSDDGQPRFSIVLDKKAAARVGGALTMMPVESVDQAAKGRADLEGEPYENVAEVLNIMSALFHDLGAPHVALGEVCTVGSVIDEDLRKLLDEPTWSLGIALDIEEYGTGEMLLLAS